MGYDVQPEIMGYNINIQPFNKQAKQGVRITDIKRIGLYLTRRN